MGSLVRDYLLRLSRSQILASTGGRDYAEQYHWLLERCAPKSGLEQDFLRALYSRRLRLPERAQHRPDGEIPAQTDFYYERDGRPGVCVFVDGPSHTRPGAAENDRAVREQLEDKGFRVVAIRCDTPMDAQIDAEPDTFGQPRG